MRKRPYGFLKNRLESRIKKAKPQSVNISKIFSRMMNWNLGQLFGNSEQFKKIEQEQESVLSSSSSSSSSSYSGRKESAKSLFPDLIQDAKFKVDRLFLDLLKSLSYRSVSISNPGAIITAPFLDQLGVVQALHTYGPLTYRSTKMTNNIIVNTLRIIAGFPNINDFRQNSDRSVAIGAGLSLSPKKKSLLRFL